MNDAWRYFAVIRSFILILNPCGGAGRGARVTPFRPSLSILISTPEVLIRKVRQPASMILVDRSPGTTLELG
jgi:hypothetical protein